jgi:opacity protein-like surface antigen
MKKSIMVIAALATLAIPAVCPAVEARPGAYLSGFVGAGGLSDTDVTSNSVSTVTFNDRVQFDPGINLGMTGGYDFGLIRLEGEFSYKNGEIKRITDQADGFRFHDPDGNLGALAVMFNAFFNLRNSSPVTPYIGGGIGVAALHLTDTYGTDTRGSSSQRLLLYPKDNDTVFAYQAGAGLEIAFNRRLSLDLGYRFFRTDKATFESDVLNSSELRYESHNGAVGLRVKF